MSPRVVPRNGIASQINPPFSRASRHPAEVLVRHYEGGHQAKVGSIGDQDLDRASPLRHGGRGCLRGVSGAAKGRVTSSGRQSRQAFLTAKNTPAQTGGLPIQACRIEHVAHHMGMHLRTLERRMKERGTSFRVERDRVRFEIARELLSRDSTTNTQIAYLLGYSGDTAFNRSFKRWAGMTPRQWRKIMPSV